MTREDKEVLIKDLCGRLPYGVICEIDNRCVKVEEINPFEGVITYDGWLSCGIDEDIKPYLRPLSSMTDEEHEEYRKYVKEVNGFTYNINCSDLVDWFNRKMFDYRGLIPKGLALEASEGMYIKTYKN